MATTAKEKEALTGEEKRGLYPTGSRSMDLKRGLSPIGPKSRDPSTGRARVPRSSSIDSSNSSQSLLPAKSVPNYLRPTISSRLDGLKNGKKQPPEDPKLIRRRSFDKPPSQVYSTKPSSTSQIQRTPLPPASKDKTLKSLPSTKIVSSQRSTPERTLKTSKSGKMQPAVPSSNSRMVKKSPSSTIKKEAKVEKVNSKRSEVSHRKEEKEPILDKMEEEVAEMESEVGSLEDLPTLDLKSMDLPDPEPDFLDEVKSEPCVCSTFSAEQEQIIVGSPHIEEVEKKPYDDNHPREHVDHSQKHKGNNSAFENNVGLQEEKLAKPQEEGESKEGETATVSTDVHKANIAQVDNPTKEREDVELKPETKNVVSSNQVVQGKKESSPAYNDVIEMTASKLVGKRKSKVKALVGAFETVISLEEAQTPKTNESTKAQDGDSRMSQFFRANESLKVHNGSTTNTQIASNNGSVKFQDGDSSIIQSPMTNVSTTVQDGDSSMAQTLETNESALVENGDSTMTETKESAKVQDDDTTAAQTPEASENAKVQDDDTTVIQTTDQATDSEKVEDDDSAVAQSSGVNESAKVHDGDSTMAQTPDEVSGNVEVEDDNTTMTQTLEANESAKVEDGDTVIIESPSL